MFGATEFDVVSTSLLVLLALVWLGVALVAFSSELWPRPDAAAETEHDRLKALKSELSFVHNAIDQHTIVSRTDAAGRITYVNDRMVELSGYARDELLGQTHALLKSGETDPAFYAQMWQTLQRGGIWTGEIKNRRKDGSFYWAQSTIMPFVNATGQKDGYIAFRTDVTAARAEHAARQLRRFLDLINGDVFVLDLDDLTILTLNDRACATLGRQPPEVQGTRLFDLFPSLATPCFESRVAGLIAAARGSFTTQFSRDGADLPDDLFDVTVRFLAPEALPPCLVLDISEASERRRAERKLLDVSSTFDEVPMPLLMFWPDTRRIFYANRLAVEHYGLDPQNLAGAVLANLENGRFADDALLRGMAAGDIPVQRFHLRGINGTTGDERLFECTLDHLSPAGEPPRFIVALRDITDEERARTTADRLASALDRIEDDVLIFDAETFEFVYLNDAARRRTGLQSDQVPGRLTSDYLLAGKQKLIEQACETLRNGHSNAVTLECQDRNGLPIEIHLRLVDRAGPTPQAVALFHDITRRKAAEKAKAQFLATVSHELRTPLTSIKGVLDLAVAEKLGPVTGKLATMLANAQGNAGRLGRLINEILDIERLGSGALAMDMRAIDLAEVVAEAVEANRPYAEKFDVVLTLRGGPRAVPVVGDPERLGQVMDNLLSNAAKFSHAGGRVDISVQADGGIARIEVRDHGIGIPEAARATVFDPFTQADSGDTRRRDGSGLGLSIAKAIVDLHDGRISFDSEENRGTTFRVDLRQGSGAGRDERKAA